MSFMNAIKNAMSIGGAGASKAITAAGDAYSTMEQGRMAMEAAKATTIGNDIKIFNAGITNAKAFQF
jgi:hypothetical protein